MSDFPHSALAGVYLATREIKGDDVDRVKPTGAPAGFAGFAALPAPALPETSPTAAAAPRAEPEGLNIAFDQSLAQWNACPALQAEFDHVGDYVALMAAEAAGRVRALSPGAPAFNPSGLSTHPLRGSSFTKGRDQSLAQWNASPALQAEFDQVGDFVALMAAEAVRGKGQ